MTGGQEILGVGSGRGGRVWRTTETGESSRRWGVGVGGRLGVGQNNKIVLSSQLHAGGLQIRRKGYFCEG